ncbi:MAG: hypothetical protein J6M60_00390 [Clostridia bacterium]|nr:hypothetical protein [Clostridia bacterium]
MQVSKAILEDTAEDIIWEFENLLCNNDVKLNNLDPSENRFENEESYINIKDRENLKNKIVKQLDDLSDYVEILIDEAA